MAQVQRNGDARISLEGALKFANIVPLQSEMAQLLAQETGPVVFDFSGVTSVDSSALSFWLCCQRKSRELGIQITAESVPEELVSIARLVGLEQELGH